MFPPTRNRTHATEPMIKLSRITLGLCLLLAAPAVWSQAIPGQENAINEAIYRQANQIRLRTTLEQARSAEARGDLATASTLYDSAWDLIVKVGLPPTAPETQQVRSGLAAVRLERADRAQRRGDWRQ